MHVQLAFTHKNVFRNSFLVHGVKILDIFIRSMFIRSYIQHVYRNVCHPLVIQILNLYICGYCLFQNNVQVVIMMCSSKSGKNKYSVVHKIFTTPFLNFHWPNVCLPNVLDSKKVYNI